MIVAVGIGLVLPMAACEVSDETAEKACENAVCPPGTYMEMNAQSSGTCSGSMEFSSEQSVTGSGAAGAASGSCYSSGSCVYACYVTTECCGAETWTTESYTCSEVCSAACGDGVCESGEDATTCPADCAAHCGNDICEYGEVCSELQCEPEETCAECGADCCPVCGNGECEWPEVPDENYSNGPGQPSIVCAQDCGGEECVPTCSAKSCGDNGCGGTCACNKGGTICNGAGQCVPGNQQTDPQDAACVTSADCPGQAPLQCVDGQCEPCPSHCADSPCNADGCGGCGKCPQGKTCLDNAECI